MNKLCYVVARALECTLQQSPTYHQHGNYIYRHTILERAQLRMSRRVHATPTAWTLIPINSPNSAPAGCLWTWFLDCRRYSNSRKACIVRATFRCCLSTRHVGTLLRNSMDNGQTLSQGWANVFDVVPALSQSIGGGRDRQDKMRHDRAWIITCKLTFDAAPQSIMIIPVLNPLKWDSDLDKVNRTWLVI